MCNVAEGLSKHGAARRHALGIALAEAGECFGTLACVDLPGVEETKRKLRRIGAMLHSLIQR